MTLVVLLVLAFSLFALAFLSKRRFGVLGLGLAAGLVLSRELTKVVSAFFETVNIPVEPLAYTTAASILLILGPAIILMISGPKYHEKRAALIGSAVFAVFGTVLLLAPLTIDFPLTDRSIQPTLSIIAANSPWIISAGVLVAIADMTLMHTKKGSGKKDKH